MPLHYSVAWVTIAPQNFSKSYNFYEQLLGQAPDKILTQGEEMTYAEFQLKGLRLGLYAPKSPTEPITSNLSLCLQVENLENAIAHLTYMGYKPPGPILTPSHGREIYAFDPDGNRLILYQPKRS